VKAAVEITIRMLLEADKTVDRKCIDRGISVLKGEDVYLPEIVTIKEAMKATHMSQSQLYNVARRGRIARIVTGGGKGGGRTQGFARESFLRFLAGESGKTCDLR